MTIPHILTISFWFSPIPPPFIPSVDRAILAISFISIAVGLFAYISRARRRRMDRLTREEIMAAANTLLWTGCVGILLYGFAFERAPYLSMRLFWIPLAVWFVWRVWTHWRRFAIEIPRIHKEQTARKKFKKWLPKRRQ